MINKIYYKLLYRLYNEIEVNDNIPFKELLCQQIVLNSNDCIITIPTIETNVNYAEEEFKWYLRATNILDTDLLKKIWNKYSDNGINVNSNYGYNIFGNNPEVDINQWNWCIYKFHENINSRQCVININLPIYKKYTTKDFPCTVALQFIVRNNKLHMIVFMRSNDIYLGFRNDIYCFSKFHKLFLNELLVFNKNLNLGNYYHYVTSLHLYKNNYEKIQKILLIGDIYD